MRPGGAAFFYITLLLSSAQVYLFMRTRRSALLLPPHAPPGPLGSPCRPALADQARSSLSARPRAEMQPRVATARVLSVDPPDMGAGRFCFAPN